MTARNAIRTGWLRRQIGRRIAAAADRRRDAGDWADAALLYQRAIRLLPARADLVVQAGNCLKEAGALDRAIALYATVRQGGDAAEAAFQAGDAHLRKGDAAAAIDGYAAAAEAGHKAAADRLIDLQRTASASGGRNVIVGEPLPAFDRALSDRALPGRLAVAGDSRAWLGTLDPAAVDTDPPRDDPHVRLETVGSLTVERDGRTEPLLTGIVAVRARIVSDSPAVRAELRLNGRAIAAEPPSPAGRTGAGRWLSVVNLWIDCAGLEPARAGLTLTVVDEAGAALSASALVHVVPAAAELDLAGSDAFVRSDFAAASDADVRADVLARPIAVRAAARPLFAGPIRQILAMRVDQLGDLAASLPALRRLGELFPDARITALVAPSLVGIVAATGICAEVIGLALAYDPMRERRTLEPAEEARLRAALAGRRFDLAIDLCPGGETRPLLRIADALHLVGFDPARFPFLDFGIAALARDKANRRGILPHAAAVSMLVEALAQALVPARPAVLRQGDDTALLASYGLAVRGYAVVHAGARHAINRWPIDRFVALAGRIAAATALPVVLFTDPDQEAVVGDPAIRCPGTVPDDHFDAILAHARLMVGNDSGPKHLAAAHGVETVGIHVNRLNWREWGQDGRGIVVTRKVPCCGCVLNEELLCGKAVACLRTIATDDVYEAMVRYGMIGREPQQRLDAT